MKPQKKFIPLLLKISHIFRSMDKSFWTAKFKSGRLHLKNIVLAETISYNDNMTNIRKRGADKMIPMNLKGDEWFKDDFPFCLRIDTLYENILPHGHDYIELTYTVKGSGVESVNGVEHPLVPGTLTLLFPHQIHQINVNSGNPPVLYVCEIGLGALWDKSDSMLLLNDLIFSAENDNHSYYHMEGEFAGRFLRLLEEMHEEFGGSRPWNRSMFKADLVKLLVLFSRYRNSLQGSVFPRNGAKSNSSMRDIIRYVYGNFKEDITLEALSEQFHMSASYISYGFKQFTGENFHSFLENMRLAHSCSLLMSSDMSVTDIAYEAGFKSYKTFSRVFAKRIRITPREYRKNSA